MKKVIVAALLVVGMTSFAQERNKTERRQHGNEMEKFTPEQRNELMLKKMTLELDLSAEQQAQMKSVIAAKTAKREAMMEARKETAEKPTADQRFAIKSKILDEQIATKAKMKSILSPEQYEKWDALRGKHHKRENHHQRQGDSFKERKEEMKK